MSELPWFLGKGAQNTYVSAVPYLVLDWETTNLEYGSPLNPQNNLVLGCWRIVEPDGCIRNKYQFGDEYTMQQLLDDIAYISSKKGFIVAHNLKFELQWLKRCGLDLRSVLGYCTMLGQWVLDGNLNPGRSLDVLGTRYGIGKKGNLVSVLLEQGVCPSAIRRDWLLRYCQQDIELTHLLFTKQVLQLHQREQLHLALVRNLTCSALADMEFEGMQLDPAAVAEEYEKTNAEWHETQEELYKITGGINLASPKQVAKYLFEDLAFAVPRDFRGKPMLTGSGEPSTNAQVMARLEAKTEEQKAFLALYSRFNKADSLLSKNLIFFKGVCDEYDGKFYGNFNQGIVGTHRLSSSGRPIVLSGLKKPKGAQLQNLPRSYKRLFWAGDDDYDIGEADGAQLEFRVGAELGHDEVAYEVICNSGDVHTDTATVFVDWNRDNPDVLHPDFIGKDYKSGRQPAKAQTFKPLYGGKGNHPAEEAYCEFFKKKYKGIADTQYNWSLQVLNNKKLRTAYGMEFYWPDTQMMRNGNISNSTQIYNYPVQGFATGEIIPIALVHFWHRTANRRIYMFTTIHDSIGSRVHKDEREAYMEISKQALTTDVFNFLRDVYNYDFKVPLGVGVKLGRNWGQGKQEHVWSVWPDGKETYQMKE
jgi:DNA polymerase I-like protein with 3'-5' exonuclease and polymerase domains